jgi:hypothetical protein
VALGCAHTNAPCPTSAAQIDQHRADVERIDAAIGRARREERTLLRQRQWTDSLINTMRANLDSLSAAGAPGAAER